MVDDDHLDMHLAKVIDHDTRGPEKRILIIGLLIGLSLLLGVVLSTILLNSRIATAVEQIRTTQQFVVQCNTPGDKPPPLTGHKCFDDTQNRVGVYITTIDKVTVAADECGRRVHGETTDAQFEECVKGKLSGPIP